jgi:hypothetical protein
VQFLFLEQISGKEAQSVERIEGAAETIEIFENDIDQALHMFCESHKPPIQDLRKEPQSVWNACLMYIKKHVFNIPGMLKAKENTNIDNNSIMASTFNAYDYDLVGDIIDYYIYLCMMYDKEISFIGFSSMTGIPDSVLRDWQTEGNRLDRKSSAISKKLAKFHEESLRNKQLKNEKIGPTVLLNHDCGYNMPGVSREAASKPTLTADQLPKLGGKLVQNHTQLEVLEGQDKPPNLDTIRNNLKSP